MPDADLLWSSVCLSKSVESNWVFEFLESSEVVVLLGRTEEVLRKEAISLHGGCCRGKRKKKKPKQNRWRFLGQFLGSEAAVLAGKLLEKKEGESSSK